jgi:GT2 family glycosyltransferase
MVLASEPLVDSAPLVSVVVVNYKSLETLLRCLDSLLKTTYPNFEVIVVDSMTDGIEEALSKLNDRRVKLVHFDQDIGAAASHNIGILASSPEAEYIAFLDNDTVVEPDWLSKLVETISSDPRIGAVQAKVVSQSNPGKMDHTGLGMDSVGTWLTSYGWDHSVFSEPMVIFTASSAAMLTRKDAYLEVWGFDDTYFIYDDDTDYSWRLRLRGYEVVFDPRAVVFHEDKLEKRVSFEKLYFGYRNRLLNLVKNVEGPGMAARLMLALYLGYMNAVLLALAGRGREAMAYCLASLNVLKRLRRYTRVRKLVAGLRRVGDRELEKRGFMSRGLYATILMTRMLLVRYFRARRQAHGK